MVSETLFYSLLKYHLALWLECDRHVITVYDKRALTSIACQINRIGIITIIVIITTTACDFIGCNYMGSRVGGLGGIRTEED